MNAVEYHAPSHKGRGATPVEDHVMSPIELRCRREALGLSQAALAGALGVQQVAVSRWESGTRAIPDGVAADLVDVEEVLGDMVAAAWAECERVQGLGQTPVLFTYAEDEALWAVHPEMRPLPAVLHRVAMGRLAAESGVAIVLRA